MCTMSLNINNQLNLNPTNNNLKPERPILTQKEQKKSPKGGPLEIITTPTTPPFNPNDIKIISTVPPRNIFGSGHLKSLFENIEVENNNYPTRLEELFDKLSWDHLPDQIKTQWLSANPGFHTFLLEKFKFLDTTVQIKAYLAVLDPHNHRQSALIVPPHQHVSLSRSNFKQAFTYVAGTHGPIKVDEVFFSKINDTTVTATEIRNRDLHSYSFDPNEDSIHNFEIGVQEEPVIRSLEKSKGQILAPEPHNASLLRALILVVYFSNSNEPNKQYFVEDIATPERATQLAKYIKSGYTPFFKFGLNDPYRLNQNLRLSVPIETIKTIDSISLSGLRSRIQDQKISLTGDTTIDDLFGVLTDWGIHLTESERISFQHSITPLLEQKRLGTAGEIYLSYKPETDGCDQSELFRFNIETQEIGVNPDHELLINVRKGSREENQSTIYISISQASKEASETLVSRSQRADLTKFGIESFATNPFNLIKGLISNKNSFEGHHIIFYIDQNLTHPNFLTNNPGLRLASLSVHSELYINALNHLISQLADTGIAYSINPEFPKDEGHFYPEGTIAEKLRQRAAKKGGNTQKNI